LRTRTTNSNPEGSPQRCGILLSINHCWTHLSLQISLTANP